MSRSTVNPDKLLKELAALWTSMAQDNESVLRACTMTLIVLSEENDDPQQLGETLAALMPDHPSRVILARLHGGAEREMTARVYAQCWKPFGQRQQICCEQIEVTGSDASLADLHPVLLALVAPDLPVVLWCRSARLFRHQDFGEIAGVARKVIVDGAELGPAAQALAALTSAPHHNVVDLAWTRLTRWRQMVAGIFENREYSRRISSMKELRLHYSGDDPPLEARYLGAWLKQCFAAAGGRVEVTYAREANGGSSLQRLAIDCPELALSLTAPAGSAAETRLNEIVTKSACPETAEHALLREELSIETHDAVFERALTEAAQVALSS
jgi:glucose-6-phosphate dehydrogenase assembly protein OpcA